ncbi:squalene--hopene cyclase [Pullulanibacillus camelliae]|uniref:Squalene--hopene cyclase n=1 Tax=Pullulanibacillus camelliae TaxID=1707096 RepID=A0A8J2YFJ9_9BACL|nr:prenyltransferase/squalene oxidase repeat-containing protein [Pullulanibacillus camelliae]GGE29268.1 squalene--hopene cyclase [Pullulanibacillus camelliae]
MQIIPLSEELKKRIDLLCREQKDDGSWQYCFEGPVMTDAYMIILLRSLEVDNEPLIQQLTERLLTKQGPNGIWKVYPNERSGNLSATVEAVIALWYSQYADVNNDSMKKAYAFIRAHGGLKKTGLLTKTFLAMNGLYPWPRFPLNPALLILLPRFSPVNFYSFSSYARAHFAPALAAFEHRHAIKRPSLPDPSILEVRDDHSYWPEIDTLFSDKHLFPASFFNNELYKLSEMPQERLTLADQRIEEYILSHIEANGTLLSYASSTFFMIYGLLALDYQKDAPIILKAIAGIESLIWDEATLIHVQNSPSKIWDTGLMSYALKEAGCSIDDPPLKEAAHYLLDKQQHVLGDWVYHNRNTKAGGWGFSASNSLHPDLDDTQVALRTIQSFSSQSEAFTESYQRGITWLLSMQNHDGGWAAFEKNTDSRLISLLPIANIKRAAIDPSTPDITGRVLHALGTLNKDSQHLYQTRAAISWLKKVQEQDGSWYGRWGVCYIYGTWAAITGLCSVGVPTEEPVIQKALLWLLTLQHEDGGWGESCESDVAGHYMPLSFSTVVQTAWATDALIAICDKPNDAINRGIEYLLTSSKTDALYPTGSGLPGAFYIHYHGYPKYWPLLTLAHYHNKYEKG